MTRYFYTSFLRNFHTIFLKTCANLYSYQQCTRFPFLHLLTSTIFGLFNNSHFCRARCYLLVILICISLMINDIEQFFLFLLAIYLLLENVYLGSLPIFNQIISGSPCFCLFSDIKFLALLVYYGYQLLVRCIHCKYFLPLLFPSLCRNF
jgi:hypothetical protein